MIVLRLTDTSEYLAMMAIYRTKNQPVLMIGITNQLTVYNTGRNDLDLEACEEQGALVIPYVSNGGTAVSAVGDLGAYFGIKGRQAHWCRHVRADLKKWLMAQGLSVHEENNDLVLYGKKFLGYTEHVGTDYSCGSIFIAMSNSQVLVTKICKKPKTRQTAGLNEYGITASEISEVIIESTKNYLNSIGVKEGGN